MRNALLSLVAITRSRMSQLGFAFPAMNAAGPSLEPSGKPRPKVLVLTGPTAVGKSATALKICKLVGGEIISADSVQVYKKLNVGSNKASIEEQNTIRHHMLDIADPAVDDFSAGDFFRAARVAIDDVHRRGYLPVVVGGTMMYVRWLIYGRPATPPAPEETREKVEGIIKSLGGDWDSGIALLARRDPQRAAKLFRNDWYRLGRALEILETTGTAMTELPLLGGAPNSEHEIKELDYDFRCVFLFGDRIPLNRRIDHRCEEMILPPSETKNDPDWDASFRGSILKEVASLLVAKELQVTPCSPARAIGYKQTLLYLVNRAMTHQKEAEDTKSNAAASVIALREFRSFVESFQAATRGYAKQQISWFRKQKEFWWIRAGNDALEEIMGLLQLSMDEYGAAQLAEEEKQAQWRSEMIAQGKLMKTYIGQRKWLQEDSEAEAQAVVLAERCSRDVANSFSKEELDKIYAILSG